MERFLCLEDTFYSGLILNKNKTIYPHYGLIFPFSFDKIFGFTAADGKK
jgi:hypothetical protein